MRVCHGLAAEFDEPNLVSCAGLAPVLQLAERAGFQQLVGEHVRPTEPGGVNRTRRSRGWSRGWMPCHGQGSVIRQLELLRAAVVDPAIVARYRNP